MNRKEFLAKYKEIFTLQSDLYWPISLEKIYLKCKCGHITKSCKKHQGILPSNYKCLDCGRNTMLNVVDDPDGLSEEEGLVWYRPLPKKAYSMAMRTNYLFEYFLKGGLIAKKGWLIFINRKNEIPYITELPVSNKIELTFHIKAEEE